MCYLFCGKSIFKSKGDNDISQLAKALYVGKIDDDFFHCIFFSET